MKTPWKMPTWMEHYRESIYNTGGNTIEDLLNRLDTDKRMSQTNIVVFTMAISVDAQVNMLTRLHSTGLLVEPEHTFSDQGLCSVCGAKHYSLTNRCAKGHDFIVDTGHGEAKQPCRRCPAMRDEATGIITLG